VRDFRQRGFDRAQTLVQTGDFTRGERVAFDDQLPLFPTHARHHFGIRERSFTPLAERQLKATAPFDLFIHEGLTLARWLKHPLPQEIIVLAHHRQRAQIKTAVRVKFCAVAAAAQLAVGDEQKIRMAEDLSHAMPLRQIHRSIGLLTSERRGHQRYAHRIECAERFNELSPLRMTILAMTIVQERAWLLIAILRFMIDREAGSVETRDGGGQGVRADQVLPQRQLNCFDRRGRGVGSSGGAHNAQHICEAIIGQIFVGDLPAGGVFERAMAFPRPRFDRGHAMIVLRQDMGQPQHGELTKAQALMIAVWRRQCGIDNVGHVHVQEPVQNERHVVGALRGRGKSNRFCGRVLLVGSG